MSRIRILSGLICLFALVMAGRLYYIQIVRGDEYAAQADRQYVKKSQTLFDRGSIYFSPRKGSPISAATLAQGFTIALNPREIEHPEDVFNVISGIMPIDEETLLAKIEADKSYTEIGKRVSSTTEARVSALELTGVSSYKERWRYYPAGKAAANAIGFVGFGDDGITLTGRYGLEKSYNDVLSREDSGKFVNFFAQIFSDLDDPESQEGTGSRRAGDIVTTIEPSVQAELERRIASVVATWKSDLTGGVVMDPSTGEILAMAVSPTFDPNEFSKEKNAAVFKNPIVDGVYEMGSIVKPIAMAAAIDGGVVTPRTTYEDKGFVLVNGAKISNYDGKARGTVDMQKVLDDSLNTGMAFVTQRLGNEGLTRYFTEFGFGTETGIDLPGEARGLVNNLRSPRDIEHVTASFGQGIALTPIATVRALSALGNGGFLPNPHLVKTIRYANGETRNPLYDDVEQVISKEASEAITRMLVNVVDNALLKGSVKLPRYTVAAKTGTAQIASPEGGYYDDRYLHSFFGYFPAFQPKFIVFLFTVYPKGAEYASHTLTHPFMDLAKFLLAYYEVPPDR